MQCMLMEEYNIDDVMIKGPLCDVTVLQRCSISDHL